MAGNTKPDLPLIILHGWSDTSKSFQSLADYLKAQGFKVVEIWLGDYISMHDKIEMKDIGFGFIRALADQKIEIARHSFDLIVHSTGGLVAREFLRQTCTRADGTRDATRTPVRRLCMLAPANFGSPLAALGKSVIGRILKGWRWDLRHLGETGQRILDCLELASPYSWQLAVDDLFDPNFPVFDPNNVLATVMVGSAPYTGIREIAHEPGSDGTVRVSTANLNAHYLLVDFVDPEKPVLKKRTDVTHRIAFAVFARNHSTIHDPNEEVQHAEWEKTLLDSLSVTPANYPTHVQECEHLTAATFAAHPNDPNFHQYMHVVFRVRDQFGAGIMDYVIDFYDPDDRRDVAFREMHGKVIEKVTTYSLDSSYRSFLLDMTDLLGFLNSKPDYEIDLSVAAARLSDDIGFRNPSNKALGLDVFHSKEKIFIYPNEPVLVELILYRDPDKRVFRLKRA
jgi:pimeloyl-ACP methyl ester carboxylesterase